MQTNVCIWLEGLAQSQNTMPAMLLQLLYLLVLGKFKLLNAKMIQVIKKQDSP
jgi:hypothetical protein